jgi:hypothetical protein
MVRPEWKKFLFAVQILYPDAIIAGGALRDLIVGNKVKDVDIFIKDPGFDEDIEPEMFRELLGISDNITDMKSDYVICKLDLRPMKNGAKTDAICPKEGNPYIGSDSSPKQLIQSFITKIIDIRYNGTEFQLIFVESDPVEFVLKRFDIGLCKIMFDGDQMIITDEFRYDLDHKQLTFSGRFTKGQILHIMTTHIPNLKKKFVDWNVVVDDVAVITEKEMPQSYRKIMGIDEAEKVIEKAKQQSKITQGLFSKYDISKYADDKISYTLKMPKPRY